MLPHQRIRPSSWKGGETGYFEGWQRAHHHDLDHDHHLDHDHDDDDQDDDDDDDHQQWGKY